MLSRLFVMFVLILICSCGSVSSPSVKDEQQHQENEVDHKHNDKVLLNVIRPDYERPAPPPPMEALYPLTEDGKVQGKHVTPIYIINRVNKNKLSFAQKLTFCLCMYF